MRMVRCGRPNVWLAFCNGLLRHAATLADAHASDPTRPTPPCAGFMYMMYSGENTFGSVADLLSATGEVTEAEAAEARRMA